MNAKLVVRWLLITLLLCIVAFFPAVLLFGGLHPPGLNLSKAIEAGFSGEAFESICFGDSKPATLFRESFFRGIAYSLTVGLMATAAAVLFFAWVCGQGRSQATKMSFTVLTLAMLPQTYLILPVLLVWPRNFGIVGEITRIVLVMALGAIPLAAWLTYLLCEEEQRKTQEQCAIDGFGIYKTLVQFLSNQKEQVVTVFLVAAGVAWGNFLVPFSLGSSRTSTPSVQATTFSSHLGRDWASICAAGTVAMFPWYLLGTIVVLFSVRSMIKRSRDISSNLTVASPKKC